MNEENKKRGFTLLEVMLSIVLLATIFGLSLLYYQNSQLRTDISSQTSNIVHYLRLAQSSAVSGLDNSNHGIHFETSEYTIFSSEVYNPSDPTNFQITLPNTIQISNISLNGGGDEVIFQKSNGETSTYGTITITSPQINRSFIITITSIGTINY